MMTLRGAILEGHIENVRGMGYVAVSSLLLIAGSLLFMKANRSKYAKTPV
jgi:hypothetical protein